MKREMVLFCRVAWMKRYQGVTDDDQPERGGAYVDKHHNAHESDNFRPYNHVCRGYFRHGGDKLNLERISGEKRAPDQLDGVTVVWVATAPDGNQYIAGWYKNASVFRYYRVSLDATRTDGTCQEYWMTAKETDCVLIPEANRDFEIPNATRIGEGRGMGQSNVWYADQPEAYGARQAALSYINSYNGDKSQFYHTAEELKAQAKDKGQSVEELERLCNDAATPYLALKYANLAVKKDYCCQTLKLRASVLQEMFCYDEAAEALRLALHEEPQDIEAMRALQFVELGRENFALSVEVGYRLLSILDEGAEKADVVLLMVIAYIENDKLEKAAELLSRYNVLCRKYYKDGRVDTFWEEIRNRQAENAAD